MNINNITIVKSTIINRKSYTYPFSPIFFMLLAVISFEIFRKDNICGFISEIFALN